jgi:hypothetical protein
MPLLETRKMREHVARVPAAKRSGSPSWHVESA